MDCLAFYYDEKDRAEQRLGRRPSPWHCVGGHAPGERHSTGPLLNRGPITWQDGDEGAGQDRP